MRTLKNLMMLIPMAALMACNSSDDASNPLRDYKGLKQAPVTDVKPVTQTMVSPDVFRIEIVRQGQNNLWQAENVGNFIEGQSSQIMVRVTPKDQKIIRYSLRIADFPLVQVPVLSGPVQGNIYTLQWNAPIGTIPNGLFGMSLDLQLQATVEESSEALLVGVASLKSLPLVLNRNNQQPQFLSRTNFGDKGLEEGVEADFVVEVNDPGTASSPRYPEISITPYIYSNTEAYAADGSSFIRLDEKRALNPEPVAGTTRWKFYYKILILNLPLDRDRRGNEIPSAEVVKMCFQMRAISVLGTQSADQQQVCTDVRYAAQPPKFKEVTDIKDVKGGTEITYTVRVSSDHALSLVTITNPAGQISSLGGLSSVNCVDEAADKKNVKICTIQWKPTCVRTPVKRTLTLKADSTLGSKVKSTTFTKEFMIQPDATVCAGARP